MQQPGPPPPGGPSTSSRQQNKVFVGGLSWETTDEKLATYFGNFGEVTEAFVSFDRNTGRPRGFGFVCFADPAVVDKVVAQGKHHIDRREVEAKKAVPKEETPAPAAPPGDAAAQKTRKIFVGGLAASVDDAALRAYFERFGGVEDAVVICRPRGAGPAAPAGARARAAAAAAAAVRGR
ncbi:DAZ-associated protein 1 [Monoraphidium neglectum]|uniref:DAZ-associated protein 1 n=1 Tax=Monoraphidium neglectum TaxID=145388 RepID=A0A0D2MQX3_9CHLO|nr:DAZ-associated protein 1 [Monoraphidium neglectum]KIY97010.1 DAZ-associated protein 1 [Monoraphidium neglectum]|eukprot:XP_013896030.1 DAZ-associated protein 1 [Monoraphidium neglectum]